MNPKRAVTAHLSTETAERRSNDLQKAVTERCFYQGPLSPNPKQNEVQMPSQKSHISPIRVLKMQIAILGGHLIQREGSEID